jgi:hypothetical protein
MNWQERIGRYLKRGFQTEDAEILVLLEECAAGLFSAFPQHFVLFGGAPLVLFFDSPRLSRDLDLLAKVENLPAMAEIVNAIRHSIQPLAETFGMGKLEFQTIHGHGEFLKIWVQANQRRLFSVDVTRIGGTVLRSEEVANKIGESDQIVITPSGSALLFQKCETFLERRIVKSRDAFDIYVLLARGASLDQNLRARLDDFIRMREFDSDSIRQRINRIDVKLCTAELRPALPYKVFSSLAEREFEPLRSSLEIVLADWL